MEQTNIYSAIYLLLQDFDILTSILCCVHDSIFALTISNHHYMKFNAKFQEMYSTPRNDWN